MSDTLAAVQRLVAAGEVKISEHGYDELAQDRISAKDIIGGVHEATVVEDYPTFPKGRAVLVLQSDGNRQPVHVVWGIPQGYSSPAVLVTAYRPDPQQMERGFPGEAQVKTRKRTKLIQEGRYVAEVEVELVEDETGWSPYLSTEDAYKLDDVREALRRGDFARASSLARVYELRPVASQ